jgi:hypothetical protein
VARTTAEPVPGPAVTCVAASPDVLVTEVAAARVTPPLCTDQYLNGVEGLLVNWSVTLAASNDANGVPIPVD